METGLIKRSSSCSLAFKKQIIILNCSTLLRPVQNLASTLATMTAHMVHIAGMSTKSDYLSANAKVVPL